MKEYMYFIICMEIITGALKGYLCYEIEYCLMVVFWQWHLLLLLLE